VTFYKNDPVPIEQREDGWYIEDIRVIKRNRNNSELISIDEEDWDKIPLFCYYTTFFPNLGSLFPEVFDLDDWIEHTVIYWRKLQKKPRWPFFYRNKYTGDMFTCRLIPKNHGSICHECGKCYADDPHWREILESLEDDTREHYFNSKGDLVSITRTDIEGTLLEEPSIWVWTNKKFPYRDYCSDECYKIARERKRKDRREKTQLKKIKGLAANERPDGHCKICGKDISDKRAGALTCGPAHRKEYNRMKKKIISPGSA
jgi:hypothetical protein